MTSNRGAVLVKNELHHGEAVEEKISLSGRFGIWVGFHAFSQDEYVAVARQWVAKLRPPRRPSPGRIHERLTHGTPARSSDCNVPCVVSLRF